MAHPSKEEVVSMDISQTQVPSGHRALIAASFGDRSIALYTLNHDGELKNRFSVRMPGDFLPKTVCFDHGSGNIYSFSFYGGYV